jgi:hypothetical protein
MEKDGIATNEAFIFPQAETANRLNSQRNQVLHFWPFDLASTKIVALACVHFLLTALRPV